MAAPKRILIVDDDPDIHLLLGKALADTGIELGSALDGVEGLSRIENEAWDLILTDVIMPGLDGLALLELVRALRPSLRVVVMTVDSTAEKIISAIREHAFSWLSKPFTLEAVREAVEEALQADRDDDIEVLSASPRWLEVRLRCRLATAARILNFVREMETGLPAADRESVGTAFREILTNAIEHGGHNDPHSSVTVTYIRAEQALLYSVRDPGDGFSFARLEHAAISNSPEAPLAHAELREQRGMRSGGFGILMTRALVDEMIYNEKGNEVLLIKYLS